MFENRTYKTKNKLLLLIAVLALLLVYLFGLKKTINAIVEYKRISENYEQAQNAPRLLLELQKKLNKINKSVDFSKENTLTAEQNILELVTKICQEYKMTLMQFPKTNKTQKGDFLIETNQFVVEGTFANLIKLVFQIEQKNKVGRVASIHYELKKNMETKKHYLVATIFIQNIKNVKV